MKTYWDYIIKPQRNLLEINRKDIWRYRDLLHMFVKRDVITVYKQTILGPIWYIIQPILTTLIYIVVFGHIAGISTDGLPQVLFYLSGITIWNYFSESFISTSRTFFENQNIFGKVYFPRLIMPLSKITSGFIKFTIQLIFFLIIYFIMMIKGANIQPNLTLFLLPLYVILMAGIGLGFGIIFTSLTAKYRDLNFLIQFGVQLLMYATPVIYPMSTIPEGKLKTIINLNPMTPILESYKYSFLGTGQFSWTGLIYSFVFMMVVLFLGTIIFNKTEKTFMDTV